jgi:hypothetical protein
MNKTQKIALISLLVIIVAAVSLLLMRSRQQGASLRLTGTESSKNASQSSGQTPANAQQSTAVATPKLEPLPADNKQAIDTELSNIDKELQTTDATTKSTDLSDANLGL